VADVDRINAYLQERVNLEHLDEVTAVDAAQWLQDARLLADSKERPGLPLRRLLHQAMIEVLREMPQQSGTTKDITEAKVLRIDEFGELDYRAGSSQEGLTVWS